METRTIGKNSVEASPESDLSLVFRNALVYTCEGGSRVTDVALSGDHIVEVGDVFRPAKRVIDAQGLALSPGFIDMHNHTDFYLRNLYRGSPEREDLPNAIRLAHNYVAQGVTTIVTGNCGVGFLEFATWERIFTGGGFGSNVCHLVPYESLLEASARAGRTGDARTIVTNLAAQIKAGAAGFSTALGSAIQSRASQDEILSYCTVLRDAHRIYVTHVRGESGRTVLQSIDESINVAIRSAVPVHLSQWRVLRPYEEGLAEEMSDTLERAQGQGIRISASQNPYGTVAQGLDRAYVSYLLAGNDSPLGIDESITEGTFERILREIPAHDIHVVQHAAKPKLRGRNLEEIALESQKTPPQIMVEFYASNPPPYLVVKMMGDRELQKLMRSTILTSSNGEVVHPNETHVHPRSYGTFPRRLAMCGGLMDDVIESMTVRPAELLGLDGRGRIRPDYYADLVLFDPRCISYQVDYADSKKYPAGIRMVTVNGDVVYEDGGFVGGPSGRLLRS